MNEGSIVGNTIAIGNNIGTGKAVKNYIQEAKRIGKAKDIGGGNSSTKKRSGVPLESGPELLSRISKEDDCTSAAASKIISTFKRNREKAIADFDSIRRKQLFIKLISSRQEDCSGKFV